MCLPLKVNAANDIQMYIQVPLLLQIAKFTKLNKSIGAQKKQRENVEKRKEIFQEIELNYPYSFLASAKFAVILASKVRGALGKGEKLNENFESQPGNDS